MHLIGEYVNIYQCTDNGYNTPGLFFISIVMFQSISIITYV